MSSSFLSFFSIFVKFCWLVLVLGWSWGYTWKSVQNSVVFHALPYNFHVLSLLRSETVFSTSWIVCFFFLFRKAVRGFLSLLFVILEFWQKISVCSQKRASLVNCSSSPLHSAEDFSLKTVLPLTTINLCTIIRHRRGLCSKPIVHCL